MRSTGKSRRPSGHRLVAAVDASLVEAGIVQGSTMLVGVSGGPDSTALLSALDSLRGKWRLSLHACIVDHGIRSEGEIEGDITLVGSLCDSLGIPLSVARMARGECARRAKNEARSLEEVARELRHRHLRITAREAGAETIALGHTRDDAIETLLMRIFQGSDLSGLAGIPLRTGQIVHPLIRSDRSDILSYLAGQGLCFHEDVTNRDTTILRNRVRHILLPALEHAFPGYRTGILMLSRKLSLAADLVRELASRLPWEKTDAGFSIPRHAFLSAPQAVRAFSLLGLYGQIRARSTAAAMKGGGSPRRLPWRFISPALGDGASREEGWIIRGYEVGLYAAGGRLYWKSDIVSRAKISYFIVVSGDGIFGIRGTGLRVEVTRLEGKVGKPTDAPVPGEISILSSEVVRPLVLRSKRKGDEILLEGGAKSLKELFAIWKVPQGDRWKVPVLADRTGVLAVLGDALGYRREARAGSLAPLGQIAPRILFRSYGDGEGRREQQH